MKTPPPDIVAWLSGILWGLGLVLKQVPKFPDWAIPVTLYLLGGAMFGLVIEAHSVSEVSANVMWGFAAAAAIVGTHTAAKQAIKRPE